MTTITNLKIKVIHALAHQAVQIIFLQSLVADLQSKEKSDLSWEEVFKDLKERDRNLWNEVHKSAITDMAFLFGITADPDTQLEAGPGWEFEAWLRKQDTNSNRIEG